MPGDFGTTTLAVDSGGLFDLGRFGDRIALRTGDEEFSYRELGERVSVLRHRLGPTRRLVVIAAANDVDTIVAYLASLDGRHPVLLVPGDDTRLVDAAIRDYDPDAVFDRRDGDLRLDERRPGSAHELHPDLAVLLSTSGSTGSAKLVRLSRDNILSNALSIADFLGIRATDRAATTLPIHYCYGLSVVNSHLVAGAGLVVTDLSVVDRCLWELFESTGTTTFAGVPYTFDLLDNSGFVDRDLPQLRYVTQAGGRLDPGRVAHYARLGIDRGWDFYVMYGQTEATARMAYLPPALALEHPETIGVPIPGGEFRLEPLADAPAHDTGELVFSGGNVMMGYAETAADLREGAGIDELHTGDIARRLPGGLYEIIGRKSRFAKVFGLRIDLDRLERAAAARGTPARCVAVRNNLHAFVGRRGDGESLSSFIAAHCGIPKRAVHATFLASEPVTSSGKTDFGALERQALVLSDREAERHSPPVPGRVTAPYLRDLYAELLGRPDATESHSFVDLGGDSLSYVELSVRLGVVLGQLPRDWHLRPIGELTDVRGAPRRRGAFLETGILLRAVGILLIVGSHANVFAILGGAHVLLAVAGFNFARFQLGGVRSADRLRTGLGALVGIAVPSMLWIGAVCLIDHRYDWRTALFLNGLLGSDSWTVQWQFWFLETLVWTVGIAVVVLAIPAVARVERSVPFGFAVSVAVFALILRFLWTGVEAGPTERYTPAVVLWCFALGWTAAMARTRRQRLFLSALVAASVAGFFGDGQRELVVATGVLLLVWLSGVHAPRAVTTSLGIVASASLSIYLTHWLVYPRLELDHPFLAALSSVAVGLVYWRLMRRGVTRLAGGLRLLPALSRRSRPSSPPGFRANRGCRASAARPSTQGR